MIVGVLQRERRRRPETDGLRQGQTGETFDGDAKQDQTDVAIDAARPDRVGEESVQRHAPGRIGARLPIERPPGGQPGGVRQQMTEDDLPRVHRGF